MSDLEPVSTDQIRDKSADVRLIIPVFLLKKLKQHPLTKGLYLTSLGKSGFDKKINIKHDNPHHHTLIYCMSGTGKLIFGKTERVIKQSDLIILPPNTPSHYIAEKGAQNSVFWINFEGELAPNIAERLWMKMDNCVASMGPIKDFEKNFNYLLNLGVRGYTATNVIHAVHLLQQSLSYLALQLRMDAINKEPNFDIDAIERLMRDNLHQDLSLDTLAHYSKLSKFHFAKKFKELTDVSPKQHFINLKMQRACHQLDNTDISIKHVGESLGYSDAYYFSRIFKKTVGMSPKQYRDSRHS